MIAAEICRYAAIGLAVIFLAVVVTFIIGVCICAVTRRRSNGYAQRYRDVVGRSRSERKRTIVTPSDHEDPRIVGDVPHQAQWPKASFPHSRANMRGRGEG